MTHTSDGQLSDFQARLNRIGRGETHLAEGLVDREMIEAARNGKTQKSAKGGVLPAFKRPGMNVIITFVIGLIAILLGRVVAFQFTASPGTSFDLAGKIVLAMGPWGLSAAFLFIVMVGLGLRDKPHVIGIASGAIVMIWGEPYIASQVPNTWAQMYSADHVDGMLIQAGLRDVLVPGMAGVVGDTSNLPKVTTPSFQYGSSVKAPGAAPAITPDGQGLPEIKLPKLK